jgi:hypothetical protein
MLVTTTNILLAVIAAYIAGSAFFIEKALRNIAKAIDQARFDARFKR